MIISKKQIVLCVIEKSAFLCDLLCYKPKKIQFALECCREITNSTATKFKKHQNPQL